MAIARLKDEDKAIKCSWSRDGPALEEFISLKGISDEDGSKNLVDDSSGKKIWMSLAQLWSTNVVDCDSHKQNSVPKLNLVKFLYLFLGFFMDGLFILL